MSCRDRIKEQHILVAYGGGCKMHLQNFSLFSLTLTTGMASTLGTAEGLGISWFPVFHGGLQEISKQSNVLQQCGATITGIWARISSRYFAPAILPTSAASPVPPSEAAHICPHPLSSNHWPATRFPRDPPLSSTGSFDTVVSRLAGLAPLSYKLLQINSQ